MRLMMAERFKTLRYVRLMMAERFKTLRCRHDELRFEVPCSIAEFLVLSSHVDKFFCHHVVFIVFNAIKMIR